MGGPTTVSDAVLLQDPEVVAGTMDWAFTVSSAHKAAISLQESFTPSELHTISLIAPRGNII
jgi:hypothetical protein